MLLYTDFYPLGYFQKLHQLFDADIRSLYFFLLTLGYINFYEAQNLFYHQYEQFFFQSVPLQELVINAHYHL